jgi:hypothetical protein
VDNPINVAKGIESLAKETLGVCPTDGHLFDTTKLWAELGKQSRRIMPRVIDALVIDTNSSTDITAPSFELLTKDHRPTGIKIYGGFLANCDKERSVQYDLQPWQRPLDHQ